MSGDTGIAVVRPTSLRIGVQETLPTGVEPDYREKRPGTLGPIDTSRSGTGSVRGGRRRRRFFG
ncbi:hypothetical protein GS506_20180 [Rhodococcus hoagii]|nr:hypothetical protein [Prescottella equi]